QAQLVQSSLGTVKPGQTLPLTCAVSGVSITDRGYGWDWDLQAFGKGWTNAPSLPGHPTVSADTANNQVSLQLRSLTDADTGTYYCARNPCTRCHGYWGQGTLVTVTSANPTAPSIFPLVPCCTKTDNAPPDTSLACLVTGYFPSPVEIKWNSGKVTQGVTTFPEVTVSNGGFTQSSLLIIPARPRQGDTYQCDVTHQGTATTDLGKVWPSVETH
uniref:Ig-like domain-containing protein n=1 Tax=Gopherus evgoodei TaxID=1825980 RepID=A0A8C4YUC9_9SAUR